VFGTSTHIRDEASLGKSSMTRRGFKDTDHTSTRAHFAALHTVGYQMEIKSVRLHMQMTLEERTGGLSAPSHLPPLHAPHGPFAFGCLLSGWVSVPRALAAVGNKAGVASVPAQRGRH